MTFYLKPPRGLVNLHVFQTCVEERLNCYDNINRNNNADAEICNFHCLVEDSPLDRTGHYLFRLYAYLSTDFRRIFLENEKKLLLLRLLCYKKEDIKYFLKRLLKHSKECVTQDNVHVTVKDMYLLFISLCSQMLNREYLNHIIKEVHVGSECEGFTLKVPFYQCASLIVHREVNLKNGFVEIKCTDWKRLFLSVYETYLRRALTEMKYSQNVRLAVNDVRIRSTFKVIQNHWFKNEGSENDSRLNFNISNIDAESKLFPLCALNLYKVLQKTNRLSHNDRFDFSLYMKGIGISLRDSLKFWENTYTRQHSSCSKCSHNWKDNEKRYIYGIRHLYGLEGSRKNYTVRSCNFFQEKILSATEDGGCPFKHFDDSNLRQVLQKLLPSKEDDVEVMIYERKENPSLACKLFYENVFKIITDNCIADNISFSNPVEYYLSLKKHISKNSIDSAIQAVGPVAVGEK
ncbi:probable DNA primase large subunit [Anoplophora glabripennis]|uniref:probable DNA primase large subunit n=1 Tax=Anoplophora glabripennis TaxID=217634 RepID=UPI000874C6D2|nr:probable DNA primase large subunit [Anoplophora glabripennis]